MNIRLEHKRIAVGDSVILLGKPLVIGVGIVTNIDEIASTYDTAKSKGVSDTMVRRAEMPHKGAFEKIGVDISIVGKTVSKGVIKELWAKIGADTVSLFIDTGTELVEEIVPIKDIPLLK